MAPDSARKRSRTSPPGFSCQPGGRFFGREDMDALEIGKAAEHLVAADLIIRGYRCYLSDQGLPYDLCVDIDGRILRIQVKGTMRPVNINRAGVVPKMGYQFNVRKRGRDGRGSRLDKSMCDIVALVAIDARQIFYLPIWEARQSHQFSDPSFDFAGRRIRTSKYTVPMLSNDPSVVIQEVIENVRR